MLSEISGWQQYEVEEAKTTEEAIYKVINGSCRIVLMDYHLPGRGAPKATQIILSHRQEVSVIALSNSDNREYAERMEAVGGKGLILKNIEADTLAFAIRTVISGSMFYSNEVALRLLEVRARPIVSELDRLTTREREILMEILGGFRHWEIGGRMGISKRTVDKHRQNIMSKMGVRNLIELVQAAVKLGLISASR
jgi:DNA-binding NarL/FixJ family response regulator